MAIPEELDPEEKRKLLAGFHKTISEQLNARLAESPRFFWALVVVSTGYGYVLWNVAIKNPEQAEPGLCMMLGIASLLSYVAVLWACWYLAALGYAFRYLQHGQHRIEQFLGWDAHVFPYGKPPTRIRRCSDIFWLLPGIYHAHVGGFVAFLAIIVIAFSYYGRQWWGSSSAICIGFILFLMGVIFIICVNLHYVWKYEEMWEKARKEVTDPTPSVETGGAPSTAP